MMYDEYNDMDEGVIPDDESVLSEDEEEETL